MRILGIEFDHVGKILFMLIGMSLTVSCAPWVATRQVSYVGEMQEFSENPQKLILSSNGSVAIEYKAKRYYQTLSAEALIQPYMWEDYETEERNFGYLKCNYLPDRKRYILLSRDSIEKELKKHPESHKETISINLRDISEKVFVHKRVTSDNASISDLPAWFGSPINVYDRNDGTLIYEQKAGILNKLEYKIFNDTYNLHFNPIYSRTERTLGGYFFQIFLPPAIVIDIARVTVGYIEFVVFFPFILAGL